MPTDTDVPVSAMTTISAALEEALETVSGDALGVIGDVLPYALAVVGAVLVVTIGIKVFKRISGK